jgi:hypothetical protein
LLGVFSSWAFVDEGGFVVRCILTDVIGYIVKVERMLGLRQGRERIQKTK